VSAIASNLLGPGLDALGAMTTWLSNQFGDGKSATTSSSSLSSSSSSSAEEGDSALTVAIASVLSSDGVNNGENNREDNNESVGGGGDVFSQIIGEGEDEENVEIPNEEVLGDETATTQIEKEAQIESIS
jgi:hypothetical protein